ncbi:MAG: lysophospholipid acyltransferase family protein [Christensenellales bacterium]
MGEKERFDRGYRFGHRVLAPLFTWLYNFRGERVERAPGPCLVMANHTMDLDFTLLMRAFPQLMHFVIGENIFQNKLLKRLMMYLHGPVIISKGGTDTRALLEMLRRLRAGQSLCLFPEGNTCFDGLTGPIHKGTASLLRASRATLVTYRVHGAYLSQPRWGYGLRRGRTWGELGGVYGPEVIGTLSDEQVNALIARDLRVDAYQDQAVKPVAYRGRDNARGIEHAVYLCPRCRGIGTLRGKAGQVRCLACDFNIMLDDRGGFQPAAPYPDLKTWIAAQRGHLRGLLAGETPVALEDPGQRLWLVAPDDSLSLAASGAFHMDALGISIGDFTLRLSQLGGLAIFRRNRLLLSDKGGQRYQLDSIPGQNMLKYRDMYEILSMKE